MRLIDADALTAMLGITDMDCNKCAWHDREWSNCKRGGDFEDACCAIENAPTIEERKGKWIRNVYDDINAWWYECSECGDYPLKNAYGHDELSQWCPHCGAKMEGEEDG